MVTYSELLHLSSMSCWQPSMSLHWVTGRAWSGTLQFHLPQKPVTVVPWAKELALGDCWELSGTKMSAGFRNLSLVYPFSHSDYNLHKHTRTFKQVKRFSLKISRAKTFREYNFCRDIMAYFTKNQESTKIYFFCKQMFSSSPHIRTQKHQFEENYKCVTAYSIFLCKQRV